MKTSRFAVALAFALVLTIPHQEAQAQGNRASPHEQVTLAFDNGKKITIEYGRPKMQHPRTGEPRKIFGALVPYGQPWRAGADEATSFVTDSDLTVGSVSVPAGSYTLYTVPQEGNKWTLIISKATGQWGIPYPGEDKDLTRTDMSAKKTGSPVQQFTIALDKTGPKSAALKMAWENTEASVPVQQK